MPATGPDNPALHNSADFRVPGNGNPGSRRATLESKDSAFPAAKSRLILPGKEYSYGPPIVGNVQDLQPMRLRPQSDNMGHWRNTASPAEIARDNRIRTARRRNDAARLVESGHWNLEQMVANIGDLDEVNAVLTLLVRAKVKKDGTARVTTVTADKTGIHEGIDLPSGLVHVQAIPLSEVLIEGHGADLAKFAILPDATEDPEQIMRKILHLVIPGGSGVGRVPSNWDLPSTFTLGDTVFESQASTSAKEASRVTFAKTAA